MSDKRVSEMTDAEVRELTAAPDPDAATTAIARAWNSGVMAERRRIRELAIKRGAVCFTEPPDDYEPSVPFADVLDGAS